MTRSHQISSVILVPQLTASHRTPPVAPGQDEQGHTLWGDDHPQEVVQVCSQRKGSTNKKRGTDSWRSERLLLFRKAPYHKTGLVKRHMGGFVRDDVEVVSGISAWDLADLSVTSHQAESHPFERYDWTWDLDAPDEKWVSRLDPEACQYSHLFIEDSERIMISGSAVRKLANGHSKKLSFFDQSTPGAPSGVARSRRKWPLIGVAFIQFRGFPGSQTPEAAGEGTLGFDLGRQHEAYIGYYWVSISFFDLQRPLRSCLWPVESLLPESREMTHNCIIEY
jgi:hypothetical protein